MKYKDLKKQWDKYITDKDEYFLRWDMRYRPKEFNNYLNFIMDLIMLAP